MSSAMSPVPKVGFGMSAPFPTPCPTRLCSYPSLPGPATADADDKNEVEDQDYSIGSMSASVTNSAYPNANSQCAVLQMKML
jgi:hypothetical protein